MDFEVILNSEQGIDLTNIRPALPSVEVTIKDAEALCAKLKARGVIVLVFHENDFEGASYGETKRECGRLARVLEQISKMIERGKLDFWKEDNKPVFTRLIQATKEAESRDGN